ncbi:hypothetical protein FHW72_001978 [Ochrobactrum sp. RC6B]|uniref:hypothetical protein n=1 Tax=Brucella TaxID=234 RepID=UPI00159CC28B|nr:MULTISPECIES: hypothetical protein [Brucella/Ochrobactrum group]MBB3216896.1 hypothetical protein [Ochrobactrum sp. RC6B]MCH6203827.1 hypothetical protein [Brucella ciceri]NVM41695.1 hypothetical protein [Brucella intermedia]
MIRIIAIGLWICAVAFGSLFFAVRQNASSPDGAQAAVGGFGGVDYVKTDVMSVPILSNGGVAGYVVTQLVYTIDSNVRKKLSVPLEFFISDEIFRKFYGSYSDTKEVEKVSFEDVRASIIADLNARFPEPVIKDLLVEQFNYISAEEIRAMNMRGAPTPTAPGKQAPEKQVPEKQAAAQPVSHSE